MDHGLGYCLNLEDRIGLLATSREYRLPESFAAPTTICHRGWRKTKSQSRMGSCTGFSRASAEEVLNWIQTRGGVVRFSAMFAYLQNQIACGLLGSDQGATIDGSCRASMETGISLDETFPYPDPAVYSTAIPQLAIDEGSHHKIRSHAVLTSYDEVLQWIASGAGVVLIGVPWLSCMTQVKRTMEPRDVAGSQLGGHAMAIHGYGGPDCEPVCDKSGRPYLDLENSHGAGWGDQGFTLVAPDVVERWGQTGATLIGISDLEVIGPRKITTYRGLVA